MNSTPSLQNSTTPSPEENLDSLITDIRGGWAEVKSLPATVKSLENDHTQLRDDLAAVRRSLLRSGECGVRNERFQRSPGRVSDDCARRIAATFIQHCARSGT